MSQPLHHRLVLINLPLVVGLAVLAIALAWGIDRLRDAATSAADEYTELRLVEEAMFHVGSIRGIASNEPVDQSELKRHLDAALTKLQQFEQFQHVENFAEVEHQRAESHLEMGAEKSLLALKAQIAADSSKLPLAGTAMDEAMLALARLAAETDVTEVHAAAAGRTVTTLMIVGVLAALLVAGSFIATALCYRAVIAPLRRFHRGVRRIASGEFSGRLEQSGPREFEELAADFNRMASELETLYRELGRKVQQASRELVRSERLASVGFLAAGVAHEINNPLNIMSGYAELALRAMQNPASANGELETALEVIREETFRCKEITEKLLSLARSGESGPRTPVRLPAIIREVARMLGGLSKYRDRTLRVTCDAASDAPVLANATEIKQVLLNLVVNALEAVAPGGLVEARTRREGDRIVMTVRDNGCGMTPDVLERVFEPFFSARQETGAIVTEGDERSKGAGGMGLGLSISFAIVQSCKGTLRASSDGPGRGSAFIMEIPVANVSAAVQ